jgi:membrane carboxypeptidase/penicillin-binding protein PbpC
LDEQRHDVPLSAISPDLQRAIVAVEDKRFFSTQVSIRSASSEPSCAMCVTAGRSKAAAP